MDIQSVCALIGGFILLIMPLSSADGSNLLRTQGLINPGGNLNGGYLFINEMRISINEKTEVLDHHRSSLPVSELKAKRWVYLEGEKDPNQKTVKAKRIYLLPHYVNPDQRRMFPFVK